MVQPSQLRRQPLLLLPQQLPPALVLLCLTGTNLPVPAPPRTRPGEPAASSAPRGSGATGAALAGPRPPARTCGGPGSRGLTRSTASSSRRSRSSASRSLAARLRPPRSSASAASPAPRCGEPCGGQERGRAAGQPPARDGPGTSPGPGTPPAAHPPWRPPAAVMATRGQRADARDGAQLPGKAAALIG